MTNKVLYTGITGDIERRLYEHKNGLVDGFTKKYHIHKLIYLEETSNAYDAISREKQIKAFSRKKKDDLITQSNPDWSDLSVDIFG